MPDYAYHYARSAVIPAAPGAVFDRLDDPMLLGAHMSEGSPMMLGSSMRYSLDASSGRAVGSVIQMDGRVLGLELTLKEAVTERLPPTRKTWETVGRQRLIVISAYRMGFETRASGDDTGLRVLIDYNLPEGPVGWLTGRLFAPFYARWCVTRMVDDTQRYFALASRG